VLRAGPGIRAKLSFMRHPPVALAITLAVPLSVALAPAAPAHAQSGVRATELYLHLGPGRAYSVLDVANGLRRFAKRAPFQVRGPLVKTREHVHYELAVSQSPHQTLDARPSWLRDPAVADDQGALVLFVGAEGTHAYLVPGARWGVKPWAGKLKAPGPRKAPRGSRWLDPVTKGGAVTRIEIPLRLLGKRKGRVEVERLRERPIEASIIANCAHCTLPEPDIAEACYQTPPPAYQQTADGNARVRDAKRAALGLRPLLNTEFRAWPLVERITRSDAWERVPDVPGPIPVQIYRQTRRAPKPKTAFLYPTSQSHPVSVERNRAGDLVIVTDKPHVVHTNRFPMCACQRRTCSSGGMNPDPPIETLTHPGAPVPHGTLYLVEGSFAGAVTVSYDVVEQELVPNGVCQEECPAYPGSAP